MANADEGLAYFALPLISMLHLSNMSIFKGGVWGDFFNCLYFLNVSQRNGYGSIMVQAMEEVLRKRKERPIRVESALKAVEFFKKLGYVTGSVGKWHVGDVHDENNTRGFDFLVELAIENFGNTSPSIKSYFNVSFTLSAIEFS